MSRGSLQVVSGFTTLVFLLLVLFPCVSCKVGGDLERVCAASSCGNIANISYPFRLKDDPLHCGMKEYELSCEDNATILYLYKGRYYVQAINYMNYTIRVVDSGLQTDNCSSLPSHSLSIYNFSGGDPYATYQFRNPKYYEKGVYLSKSIIFLSCEKQVNSSSYVKAAPCLNETSLDSNSSSSYEYVMVGYINPWEIKESCTVNLMAMISSSPVGRGSDKKNVSFSDIFDQLVFGFELLWLDFLCDCHAQGECDLDINLQHQCLGDTDVAPPFVLYVLEIVFSIALQLIPMYIVARFFLCGIPCFGALLIRKWRRRHLSAFDSVEDFLRCHNNLMPIRYSYSDIKKMTKGFKDKLGQGGFASVYKAKLRSGSIVAIKVLSTAKGNGQDFINEVGTIGRIHHVNVVKLIGYCADRSKRALVYEFMPNGSLEKYIFQRGDHISLTCTQMFEIALGVARGIQ